MALPHTLGTSFVLMNKDESTVTYQRQSTGPNQTVYGVLTADITEPQTLVIRHSTSTQSGVPLDRHNISFTSVYEDSVSGAKLPLTLNITLGVPRIEDIGDNVVKDHVMRAISLLYGTVSDADLEGANVFTGDVLVALLRGFS